MSTEQSQQIIDTGSEKLTAALGSSVRYVVPPFQRDYSWGKSECELLWSDILDLNDTDRSHFLGHIVLSPKQRNLYELIDGQQRLTTILLITLAAAIRFKEAAQQGEDKRANNYRVKLCKDRIFTVDVSTLQKLPRITLSYRNDKYFRKLITQLKRSDPKEHVGTNKKICDALNFFHKEFSNMECDELANALTNMYEALFMTVIKVNSMLSAFSVFESINSKGSQLQVSDLVKNLLMEKIVGDSTNSKFIETSLAEIDEKWGEIINHVKPKEISNYLRSIEMLNSQGKIVTMRKLFLAVRERVNDKVSAKKYLDELMHYAKAYNAFRGNGKRGWLHKDKSLSGSNEIFGVMKLFNIRLPISLFMAAADEFEVKEFNDFTKAILFLTIRYNVVCDNPSRDLEKVYVRMAKKIKSRELNSRDAIQQLAEDYNPPDEEFKNHFSGLTAQKNRAEYFLTQIESHLANKTARYFEVEKLITTDGNGYWRKTLGMEPPSNVKDSLANYFFKKSNTSNGRAQTFEEFKQENEHSPYNINREIAEKDGWDRDSITTHQRWLANQAVDVWKLEVT